LESVPISCRGRLYLSRSAGNAWQKLSLSGDVPDDWRAVSTSGAGQYLLVGGASRLFRSSNYGSTWTEVAITLGNGPAGQPMRWRCCAVSGVGNTQLAVAVESANSEGTVGGSFARIYRSTNYGIGWSLFADTDSLTFSGVFEDPPTSFRFPVDVRLSLDGTRQLLIGDNIILHSRDNGVTWYCLNDSPEYRLDHDCLHSAMNAAGDQMLIAASAKTAAISAAYGDYRDELYSREIWCRELTEYLTYSPLAWFSLPYATYRTAWVSAAAVSQSGRYSAVFCEDGPVNPLAVWPGAANLTKRENEPCSVWIHDSEKETWPKTVRFDGGIHPPETLSWLRDRECGAATDTGCFWFGTRSDLFKVQLDDVPLQNCTKIRWRSKQIRPLSVEPLSPNGNWILAKAARTSDIRVLLSSLFIGWPEAWAVSGLYISEDAGQTWRNQAIPHLQNSLADSAIGRASPMGFSMSADGRYQLLCIEHYSQPDPYYGQPYERNGQQALYAYVSSDYGYTWTETLCAAPSAQTAWRNGHWIFDGAGVSASGQYMQCYVRPQTNDIVSNCARFSSSDYGQNWWFREELLDTGGTGVPTYPGELLPAFQTPSVPTAAGDYKDSTGAVAWPQNQVSSIAYWESANGLLNSYATKFNGLLYSYTHAWAVMPIPPVHYSRKRMPGPPPYEIDYLAGENTAVATDVSGIRLLYLNNRQIWLGSGQNLYISYNRGTNWIVPPLRTNWDGTTTGYRPLLCSDDGTLLTTGSTISLNGGVTFDTGYSETTPDGIVTVTPQALSRSGEATMLLGSYSWGDKSTTHILLGTIDCGSGGGRMICGPTLRGGTVAGGKITGGR
jgi:photosystem II stability/assembly factor-like uncharacterized protein